MFSQSNVIITGGNFWHTELRVETAFEKLQKASAPSAFHDSSARFDAPKCHPNTRIAILEYLMEWIFGRSDPKALILWLYGPAGAGKSAILQTIAELCFERKVLLASFFFGRSDPTRDSLKPFVSTIAYQIAITIPELKPVLENIIERDPLIFNKSIATQFQSLIVEPLKDFAASGFFNNCVRLLVLIDGLDECQDPTKQSTILTILAKALRNHKLPLIFLIASRPEQHITLTFSSWRLSGLWRSLVLDDSFKPDDDIRLFLQDSFQEIRTTHPHHYLIPTTWPEPSDIDKLVRKSSGQFIYSSVVVKYVSEPFDRPSRRLQVIMGLHPVRSDVPFAELDALYMHILGSCPNPDTVLLILGMVITGMSRFPDYIESHLDLERGDVEIALAPLASIVEVRDHVYIQLRHASFGDFLVDISRSGPFYINALTVKEHVIPKSISKLMNPYSIVGHNWPGQTLLVMLMEPFQRHPSYLEHDLPLAETVKRALNDFSLPRFWSIWLAESHRVTKGNKVYVVSTFLKFLSGRSDLHDTSKVDFPPRSGFLTIYQVHISSFESIIRSEVQKYYQDVGLTSLVVIAILDSNEYLSHVSLLNDLYLAHRTLLRMTEEAEKFDGDSLYLASTFGRDLLTIHYYYLFSGPRKLAEVCPDGDKHAEVTLKILQYLCHHPPYPIPYQKRQTPKIHSQHTRASGVSNQHHHSFPPRSIIRRMRLRGNSFLRKRREEKHRHGVGLSIPDTDNPANNDEYSSIHEASTLGLLLLPDILDRSSNSPELVDFMLRYGRDIVFVPKWTRKAIRAMHRYLNRVDEDAEMFDLRTKFAAIIIE